MPYTTSRWLPAAVAAIAAATVAIIGATALPAAAQTAGFGDVPQDAHYATPVADFHAKGVFNGTLCEDGFCPWEPIDRKTMAVWTVRVLDGQDPPPITRSRFNDVDPASFHARFIERMAELEVTTGCGDGSGFCPDRNVSRAQMAVFLSRAYNLPAGADPDYDDVPNDAWYAADVAKLAASGITVGCSDTMFCPSRDTSRGQMATFLWRAENPGWQTPTIFADDEVFDSVFEPLSDVSSEPEAYDPTKQRQVPVTVIYCGKEGEYSDSEFRQHVEGLNRRINIFLERQALYLEDGQTPKLKYMLSSGGVVSPSISWDTSPLGVWNKTIDSNGKVTHLPWDTAEIGMCRQAAGLKTTNMNVLIVAGVEKGGRNGVAVYGGPAVVVSEGMRDKAGDEDFEYLGTVVHELGHAFERLGHPWTEKLGLCKNIVDLKKLSIKFLAKGDIEVCNAAIMAGTPPIQSDQADEMFESLMSYTTFGSERRLIVAYFACYQRVENRKWIDWSDCETDIPPPSVPAVTSRPTLEPMTNSIVVSWLPAQADERALVTDYDVQYRTIRGDDILSQAVRFLTGWKDWRHDSSLQRTEITGLNEDTIYEVRVQARNRIGPGRWSDPNRIRTLAETGQTGELPWVEIKVGDNAEGEPTSSGPCSAYCRWLHVELRGDWEPGPHTLACAHDGIQQLGASRGVYRSARVSQWPDTRSCFFGYPGSRVFVIVGAELRDGIWHGGRYSEPIEWPDCVREPHQCPDDDDSDLELRISWGSDASSRQDCPANTACRNLSYEYIGDWRSSPYSVECWTNGRRNFGPFQWSGRPHTGCYYWGDTAQVVINGVQSNTITFDDGLEVRIDWGSDASNRSDCPANTACRNLSYEYIGDWPSPPYSVECWGSGRIFGPFQWSGRPHTGCYYWGDTAQVVINGVRSNTITFDVDDLEVRIDWGSDASNRSDCPANTACRNLSYEYIGDWPSPPYSVECWGSGRIFGPFQWSGRPHTGCYYWGDTAQVVINGARSNVLRWEDE